MEITRIKEKKSLHTFKDSTEIISLSLFLLTQIAPKKFYRTAIIENIKSDHPSFAYERWSQLINLVTMEYYSTSQISFVSSSSMKL